MDDLISALQEIRVRLDDDAATQRSLALNLGFYRAAEDYCLAQDAINSNDYFTVLEYGKLLFRQSRWGRCASLLDEFLRRNLGASTAQSIQHDLMGLVKSASAIYTRGALRPALTKAKQTRTWLKSNALSTSHLTSFEVRPQSKMLSSGLTSANRLTLLSSLCVL